MRQSLSFGVFALDARFCFDGRVPDPGSVDGSVKVRLALRPRMPSLMNPHPLIGVAADPILNHMGEPGGVNPDFLLEVTSSCQRDLRIESKSVSFKPLVPNQDTGHNGRVRTKCKHRQPGARTRGYAEEIAEHTLIGQSVDIY